MKTQEFRVLNNRLLFKCPHCGKRRNLTILNNLRRKTLSCLGCGEQTRCVFNRRPETRDSQSGVLTLKTDEGKEMEVILRDISARGVGFEIQKSKDIRSIKIGRKITISCNWDPYLLSRSQFVVQNISGNRVGTKKVK